MRSTIVLQQGGGVLVKARPWSALEVDRDRQETVNSRTWGGQHHDRQQQQQQKQQQRPASALGTSSSASSRVPSSRPSSALATVTEAKGADGGQGKGWARPMSAASKRREPPARPRPPLRIPTGRGGDERLGGSGDIDDEWERDDDDDNDDDDDDEGLGIEADDSEVDEIGEEDDRFDVGAEGWDGKGHAGGHDVAGGGGGIAFDQRLFASSKVQGNSEGAGGSSGGGKSKIDEELRVFAEELKALLVGHGLGEHRHKIDTLEKLGCMVGAITEHEDRDGVWRSSGSGSRGFMGAQFEANFRRRPPSIPLTERRSVSSKRPLEPLGSSNGSGNKNAAPGAYSNIFQAYEKAKIRTVHSSILLRPRPASARPPSAASSIKARGASRPNSALEAR